MNEYTQHEMTADKSRYLVRREDMEKLVAERDHAILQAQIHAQEARTQQDTVAEIYQLCSGGKGELGDWHGAEPVRKLIKERDGIARELEVERHHRHAVEESEQALAAHVERINAHAGYVGWKPGWSRMAQILAEGPETSLARLKLQWQAEALERIRLQSGPDENTPQEDGFDAGWDAAFELLGSEAVKLRRQAEAQPHSEDDV